MRRWVSGELPTKYRKGQRRSAAYPETQEATVKWIKTKSGKLQSPTKQDFIYWIAESLDEVTVDCEQAGFEEGCWKILG